AHPCTFCIIPQLRGGFRSRRFESVVREAENLGRAGAREVSLIAQDTPSYGEDLGLRDGFALLLEGLAQVPELCWVRFLYCYPNQVTPRLLETIALYPKLVKYMDMPLQHASRRVLARMKRGSHGDAFLKLLERIRATVPGITLRTSFIVGFPGETQADFEELCSFVRAAEFDWMGVFCYSDVDNAKSFALDGKVYITDIEAPADSAAAQPGDMVTVEITESHAYDLVALVVEVLDASRRLEERPTVQGSTPNPLRQIVTGAPLRILA